MDEKAENVGKTFFVIAVLILYQKKLKFVAYFSVQLPLPQ